MPMSESRVSNIMHHHHDDQLDKRHATIHTPLDNLRETVNEEVIKYKCNWDQREFLAVWEKELDDEFQKAQRSNPNFVITPPAGSLHFDVFPTQGHDDFQSGKDQCREIAHEVMVYWSKAIALGSAVVLSVVSSVTNDAMSHEEPLYQDLLSLRTNIKVPYNDYWLNIHTVIMQHVRNIRWSVTEVIDGSVVLTEQVY